MLEGEPRRVQELPLEAEIPDHAVQRVAGDGEIDRGEVDANLVCATRLEADAQERVSREEPFDLEMRHRGPRRVRVERVAEAVVAVAADGRVDRATARAGPSYDEPEVLAGQCPAPEEALQPLVGPMRPRDDEQARRVAVEAVDDAGAVRLPTRRACGCERMREGAGGMAGRGMDDDSRGLVHDEKMLVRIGDRELGCGDVRLWRRRLRSLDLDLLPTRELVALPPRPSVDQHRARVEQPLGRSPRTDVRQAGEVAVEPLSCRLERDDEAVQRFAERGSRSARRRAERRIRTPITMKLSARLNAGQ